MLKKRWFDAPTTRLLARCLTSVSHGHEEPSLVVSRDGDAEASIFEEASTMGSTFLTISVVLVSILAGIYQLYLKPKLDVFGVGRVVEAVGTRDCITVPDLQACESALILHSFFTPLT